MTVSGRSWRLPGACSSHRGRDRDVIIDREFPSTACGSNSPCNCWTFEPHPQLVHTPIPSVSPEHAQMLPRASTVIPQARCTTSFLGLTTLLDPHYVVVSLGFPG